jgi:hypothetical protein
MDMKRAKAGAKARDQSEPIGERIMAKKSEAPKRLIFKSRGSRQNNRSERITQ